MVAVLLWGTLRHAVGGVETVQVEASNLRDLLTNLGAAYPSLQPHLDKGVSVAIDGLIFNDDWFQPITPNSEVALLPRITGG
jgi:molybdopterin converting factor small subunit